VAGTRINVHRLGNLTIATQESNNKYGNLPFKQKRQVVEDETRDVVYAKSSPNVQRILNNNETFDRDAPEEQGENIVQFALDEWSISTRTADGTELKTIGAAIETSPRLVVGTPPNSR